MIFRLAVAAVLAMPAVASAQKVDFDQGLDVKAVLEHVHRNPSRDIVPVPRYTNQYYRWSTRECARLKLPPGGPGMTEAVWLNSTDFERDCHWVGDPRHGGGQQCWDRPAGSHHERVQVEVRGARQTFPWEAETFEACLEGTWLTVRPAQVAYRYDIKGDPAEYGRFIAVPGSKVRMDPDGFGILASLTLANNVFTARFEDKWAAHYAGEKTRLHAELWKNVEGWFDSKAAEVELEVAAAPKFSAAFNGLSLEAGKKYYVKWNFRRIGAISKDTEMKGNQPADIVYQPGLAATGR